MSNVVFDESTHTYTVDGQVLPSVTEIIRFLHYDTAVGADKAMRDYAADRGTRIHEACTAYDFDGEDAEVDADIVGYVQAYAAFKRDYGIADWLYYEKPIGSVELGFAGTPDRIGLIDGKMAILDFKTGSNVNKHALEAQLNGYEVLASTTESPYKNDPFLQGLRIERLVGLQLKKDGAYRIIDVPLRERFFATCLRLHRFTKGEYDDAK